MSTWHDLHLGRVGIGLAAALLCAGAPLWAQPAPADEVPLRLKLATLTDTIEVCQPLRLVLTATVPEGQTLVGDFVVDLWAGRGGLQVRGPSSEYDIGSFELMDPNLGLGDWVPPNYPVTREAGHSDGTDFWLAYRFKQSQFVFEEPGTYTIRARIGVFVGRGIADYKARNVQSAEVKVTVTEAASRFALRAWRLPRQMGAFFQDGGEPHGPFLSYLDDDSYAAYARYALSADIALPLIQRIGWLKDLLAAAPSPQLHDLALLCLAKLLQQAADYAACKEYASQVLALETAPPWRKAEARRFIADAEWRRRK